MKPRYLLARLQILAAAVVVLSGSEAIGAPLNSTKTPDGRFGTPCFSVGLSIGETEICELSFYKLLANPERYDGRYVRLTGFLVDYLGKPILFPQRGSYEASANMDGIIIESTVSGSLSKKIKRGIWPAIVIGKFNAKCWGNMVNFSGCIEKVWNIVPGKATSQ